MKKSKLRREYEGDLELLKKNHNSEYLWKVSNTKYIEWLEAKMENLPPPEVYVLYWADMFNVVDPPKWKVYRSEKGALMALERLLIKFPEYEDCWEIRHESARP